VVEDDADDRPHVAQRVERRLHGPIDVALLRLRPVEADVVGHNPVELLG
jgi:hypothetical protein